MDSNKSHLYLCSGRLQVANVDLRSWVQIWEHGLTPLGEFKQGLVELLHQGEVVLKLFHSVGQNGSIVGQYWYLDVYKDVFSF